MEQNTHAWLELRKNKIGASDAPVIMGESPWKTPYQLWQLKLGLKEDAPMNQYMKRGHDLEPKAREAYNKYTNSNVEPKVMIKPDKTWMMASLDGYDAQKNCAVEIKCPGQKDHAIAAKGQVPKHYYAQLQHQLEVLNLNVLHYFSFSEENFHLVEVERDDRYIANMLKEEENFWQCMVSFKMPKFSDRDFIKRTDQEWLDLEQQWQAVNHELKSLEEKEKELRSHLISLSGNRSSIGSNLKVMKYPRKGSVNYREVPELNGVNLDKYRKPSTMCWRFESIKR